MTGVKTNQMTVPIGSAPNPDPTVRTMELVDRGLAGLRNELNIRFEGVTAQFNGVAESVRIVKEDAVRVPTLLQTAILGLRELLISADGTLKAELIGRIEKQIGQTDQHFSGIQARFTERDIRFELQSGAAKQAVDAAFAAAKETTNKIESGFTKQIDQLGQIMNATNGGLNDKVDDLKERIGKIETMLSTMDRGKDKSVAVISSIIAGVVGFVVVMGGLVALVSFVVTRH